MHAQSTSYLSPEDYLTFENQSQLKHEYVNGEIFTMVGTSLRHNTICLNIALLFRTHLNSESYRIFMSDIKLRAAHGNAYYYPDIIVSCDPKLQLTAFDRMIDTPTLVVEVLSASTEGIDRREKLIAYRKINSLQEYVLVSQQVPKIEVYRRIDELNWDLIVYEVSDFVEFRSLNFSAPIMQFYESLSFDQ